LWFWSENNELKFSDFTLFFTILNWMTKSG
jgi:hypothetical protein